MRFGGAGERLPEAFREEGGKIGFANVTTTVHDNYLSFLKLNLELAGSPTDRVTSADCDQNRSVMTATTGVPAAASSAASRTVPTVQLPQWP